VANMPGAVARTSTIALTNATIEYALEIANKGYRRAILENPGLAKGVNVMSGKVTYRAVAEALNLPFTPLEKALKPLG
jgi:alanine dehydrogenase